MSKALAVGIAGVTLSFAMLAFGYLAGSRPAAVEVVPSALAASRPTAIEAGDRAEIEKIVREYLIANPEVLLEAQQALEDKRKEEDRIAQQETITDSADELFNSQYDGIVGNPEGSITIVEFFDYNCGFCERALDDMQALVEADPDLRFVLKEFPILGPDSQKAHVVSMAFRALAPEKYGEFHRDLLMSGRATEAAAIEAALALGVDEAALRDEMKNPEIAETFGRTYQLANALAITGTPSYVVGNEVVYGALGHDVLAEKIEIARACEEGVC